MHEPGDRSDAESDIGDTPPEEDSLSSREIVPKFTLSESTLKNIAAISRINEAQLTMMSRTARPYLDTHAALQKRFARITSDLLKNHASAERNLNLIVAQLTRNVDFGAAGTLARVASTFIAQQAIWLKNFTPAIAAMRAAFYPPNLRGVANLRFMEVEQVVMADGIPLYGVPRTSIAEALIRADGAGQRRQIMGRRWKSISADCRAAIDSCTSEAVENYIPFARAALDALDAEHTEAAQALAGSLVDAVLSSYFGSDRMKYTPDRRGQRTRSAYDEFSVRQFIAFAPIWQTYQQFFASNGDKVPTTFSRNATAHTVSRRQFNRRNAVQGLMVACSLLYRLDEEATASKSSA
jgi:hypothetical protein